uniref:Uncharacterized protein n=1 Tax=Arundo donax TaxID=35708 RepID=A0A0A8ZP10_ARUDO
MELELMMSNCRGLLGFYLCENTMGALEESRCFIHGRPFFGQIRIVT